MFPGTFALTGRIGGCERTPTMSWLGEGERWLRVSDPSHLSQLNTKGRRRNVQSLPVEGVVRPCMLGSHSGGSPEQPRRGREEEEGRAGKGWWGCEEKVKRGGKGKGKLGVEGAQLPELSRLLLARAREKGKGSD